MAMRWFRRPTPQYITISPTQTKERISKDVWHRCESCGEYQRRKDWVANWQVCFNCGRHDRLGAAERIDLLVDEDSFEEIEANLVSGNPLDFVDSKTYPERIQATRSKTGLGDAVVSGRATIGEVPVSLAVMDFAFMGGSMGVVAGEKIARAMEVAIEEDRACITVAQTGGARMQEGILSLMQLAKTSFLCKRMQERGIPFISILTDPSTAGVMASFASLGDVIIAEPGAMVGFAGRRVIEATIRQALPEDFQTAEFVLEHGFIDVIVKRTEMRALLMKMLRQMRGLPALVLEDNDAEESATAVEITTA
jgi:acetyl-CoA carboxylase carboxyl transferase subunit beta